MEETLKGSFLITGGTGFFGMRLALRLLKEGCKKIHLFDIRPPKKEPIEQSGLQELWDAHVKYFSGDIRKEEDIRKAMQGVDSIFHLASYGMSGREMISNYDLIYSINVNGTKSIIKIMIEEGIENLVYTSTYNVVFQRSPILGEVDPPYPSIYGYYDNYGKTKRIAEEYIRSCNFTPIKNGKKLKIVSLRPAGIYGDGEERHFPRVISMARGGIYSFNFGKQDKLTEWVYVDNLVHAHILAMKKLINEENSIICGKAYPISDHKLIDTFWLTSYLLNELGYPYPKLSIPIPVAFYLAYTIEILHHLCKPIYNFTPLLTRSEILKVGVSHYFSVDRVINELSYRPIIPFEEGLRRMVEYFKKR